MPNISTPRLEQRNEQPCVFIRAHVRMGEIGPQVPALVPKLFDWVGLRGVKQDGPVFFRYNVVDMDGLMEIDVGMAVKEAAAGDAQVKAGVIPGGTYLTMRHTGHPSELMEATGAFLDWGNKHSVVWRKQPRGNAEVWDARFEFYIDGPDTQPDMTKWRTDLAFQVEAR
ncbi:MAG: GyrI-like domain-containing protein [Rhizobacter sp.]